MWYLLLLIAYLVFKWRSLDILQVDSFEVIFRQFFISWTDDFGRNLTDLDPTKKTDFNCTILATSWCHTQNIERCWNHNIFHINTPDFVPKTACLSCACSGHRSRYCKFFAIHDILVLVCVIWVLYGWRCEFLYKMRQREPLERPKGLQTVTNNSGTSPTSQQQYSLPNWLYDDAQGLP